MSTSACLIGGMIAFQSLGLFCTDEQKSTVTDSFCSSYNQVIQNKDDALSVAGTLPGVKRRTAANDLLYRCTCDPSFKHKLCPPK